MIKFLLYFYQKSHNYVVIVSKMCTFAKNVFLSVIKLPMLCKKIICVLLFALVGCNVMGQTSDSMPILRVNFDGKFKKGMDYVMGQMQLTDTDGSVIELPAIFKTRGATASSYMMKPSFNMKLRTDDYSEELDSALLGMRSCSSWILDGMAIDRICMRNRVAFDIWNEFSRLPYNTSFDGRYGTEGRFLEVYINNQYYGIYCLNDRINRKLLNLKKVKEQNDGSVLVRGVLYKSGTSSISNQNEPGYNEDSTACVVSWHNAWELSYPEDNGGLKTWQPLLDAFAVGKSKAYVKKYFYLQNMADYQIHVMALSIGDNWGNKNHFLSVRNITKDIDDSDPSEANDRRFVLIPWDLDTSFGGGYDGRYYDGNYSTWPVNDINKNSLYPVSPVGGDAEYKAILKSRWEEGRRGAFSIVSINSKLDGYRDLFLKSGAWQRMVDYFDNKSSKPKYVADLSNEIEHIKSWYMNRFFEMDAYFGISDEDCIDEINKSQYAIDNNNTIYDLSGRKMNSQLRKGLYIKDGKKIFIQQ